jgi:hypothetical protein
MKYSHARARSLEQGGDMDEFMPVTGHWHPNVHGYTMADYLISNLEGMCRHLLAGIEAVPAIHRLPAWVLTERIYSYPVQYQPGRKRNRHEFIVDTDGINAITFRYPYPLSMYMLMPTLFASVRQAIQHSILDPEDYIDEKAVNDLLILNDVKQGKLNPVAKFRGRCPKAYDAAVVASLASGLVEVTYDTLRDRFNYGLVLEALQLSTSNYLDNADVILDYF